jgi:hypothetical protein
VTHYKLWEDSPSHLFSGPGNPDTERALLRAGAFYPLSSIPKRADFAPSSRDIFVIRRQTHRRPLISAKRGGGASCYDECGWVRLRVRVSEGAARLKMKRERGESRRVTCISYLIVTPLSQSWAGPRPAMPMRSPLNVSSYLTSYPRCDAFSRRQH